MALATFDLDEDPDGRGFRQPLAGVHGGPGAGPAAWWPRQAMTSLTTGARWTYRYMAFTPATRWQAGRASGSTPSAPVLPSRCCASASTPRGGGTHPVASPARRRAGAHLRPPASIWWPHGADAGDGSLRGHPCSTREAGMLTGQTRGTLQVFAKAGWPASASSLPERHASWQGELRLQRFPQRSCPYCGRVSHPMGQSGPAPAPVRRGSWAGPLDLAVCALIRG